MRWILDAAGRPGGGGPAILDTIFRVTFAIRSSPLLPPPPRPVIAARCDLTAMQWYPVSRPSPAIALLASDISIDRI